MCDVRSADRPGGPTAVRLLLHGYGSSERDLAGRAPALDLGLPKAALRAPLASPGGGAAWFANE